MNTTLLSEPVLEIDSIQGHSIPGFESDHQVFLFMRIEHPKTFRSWLGKTIPFVTTAREILERRRGSRAKHRNWLNLAFTFAGLEQIQKVAPKIDLSFRDDAFTSGMCARSIQGWLGDPVGKGNEGDPSNWLVGGVRNPVHLVLILGADDDLRKFVPNRSSACITDIFSGGDYLYKKSGLSLVFRQDAGALPAGLYGHEHFGFRDGISQPGIRGRIGKKTFLTVRTNPKKPHQGNPGQDLVWPGEFIFGYPGQCADRHFTLPGQDPARTQSRGAPEWARNGSLLVIRRLRQRVGMFHEFLKDTADSLGVSPFLIGAKLIGRWPSGAPLVMTPDHDDPEIGGDETRNNDFEYDTSNLSEAKGQPQDHTHSDPFGEKCPFSAHIRKVFPRNDFSRDLRVLDIDMAHTHRLLRRGIPYGSASQSTPQHPTHDDIDRGLMFLAFQTSICEQFEYVTKSFANDHNFKIHGTGYDPIIGQNDTLPNRWRAFKMQIDGQLRNVQSFNEWVIPTGGDYFFAPSIEGLTTLSRL